MPSPTAPEIVALLEEALAAEPGSIQAGQVLVELSEWDSMGIVSFVGETAELWDIQLSVDDIQECVTVDDLVRRILAGET